jgi:hypothetical protein
MRLRWRGSGVHIERHWRPNTEPSVKVCGQASEIRAQYSEIQTGLKLLDSWTIGSADRMRKALLGTLSVGRPTNSGTWESPDGFIDAVRVAAVALRRQRRRPTQENVADFFVQHDDQYRETDPYAPRRLREWRKRAGFDTWESLIAHVEHRDP